VLDYSKLENKKVKIECIPFSVAEVICQTGMPEGGERGGERGGRKRKKTRDKKEGKEREVTTDRVHKEEGRRRGIGNEEGRRRKERRRRDKY
jgi:hypothetical protein